MDLERVILRGVAAGASVIHMQDGSKVTYRIHGRLRALDAPPLDGASVEDYLRKIVSEERWGKLEEQRRLDFAYQPDKENRFRVNVYYQRGTLSVSFRTLPTSIPPFESLNLPPTVLEMADEERGLVLVTGTTSSGKSTTLAAMIDSINARRSRKILTIEDPIEFLHHDKKSYVSQRELGEDTTSFSDALRGALRQDPDVVFIGELRDYETMVTAIRAADTGHLVFSTVHTSNATQTLQRLIAVFPPAERELLTLQLASTLQGVISMRLAQRADEKGCVPVVEIMRNTPIVRKLILESRYSELPSTLASREIGMQLFDQHLVELVQNGKIRNREALRLASNPENVGMVLSGVSSKGLEGGIIG